MGNILIALQMGMQGLQMLQQVQQMLQVAATEGRDLTDDELNSLGQVYAATHAAVDAFLAGKTAQNVVTPDGIQGSGK